MVRYGRRLSRFDGKQYRNYYRDSSDPDALGNSSVYALYVAAGGELWVGTAGGVYIYDSVHDRFRRFSLETENHVLVSSRVNTFADDGGEHIWIGTQGQGAFVYDCRAGTLRQSSRHASMVSVIRQAPDGNMIVGSEIGTLSLFTRQGDFIRTFYADSGIDDVRNAEISGLCSVGDTLWFGLGVRGFRELVPGGAERSYAPEKTSGTFNVQALYPYSDRELLVGTNSGLYFFDTSAKRFTRIGDADIPFGSYNHSVKSFYRDREGGIWIATEYGGVCYLPRRLKKFEQYLSLNIPETRGGMIVTGFCEGRGRNLWVGTVDGGLFCFHMPTGKLTGSDRMPFIANIQCLMLDGRNLWVGTAADGLYIIDTRTGAAENHRHRRYDPTTIGDNNVTALLRDSKGRIYIGTAWGLNRYDRSTGHFYQEARANNQANVSAMIEDRHGNVWIATHNIGVFRYTPEQDTWRAFVYNSSQPQSLRGNDVTTLFEDQHGRIWFGTEKGLCYYTYKSNAFTQFDPDGFGSNSQLIAGILQDRGGRLWVSGNTGICCIDIAAKCVVNRFGRLDGLQSNQFNPNSCFRNKGGKLFFGGVNGFNAFNPDRFRNNTYCPETRLTNIYINSREAAVGDDSPLERAVYDTKRLKLSYSQNSLTFDYAAFSYQSPRKNRYRYRLVGWHDEWVEAGNQTQVSYSNLPPGKYRFEVEGTNNDGVRSRTPAGLDLIIVPPFYRTTSAYVFYLLLAAGLLVTFIAMQNRRHHRRLREYAVEQEKAAYRAKIDFFTNLAHEIRTPLSLIKAPLESIIKSGDGNIQTRNYLDIIDRNVVNLLNLINQLLDFRKMEEVNYSLNLAPCDVRALVEDICIRFRAAIETSDLHLETDLPEEPALYNIDRDAMTKIVGNVLGNAVKYAASHVRILLECELDGFRIEIDDDGPGVDDKMQLSIFKPFYRAANHKTGTGLGLPLARLLAEKHGGTLRLLPSERGARFEIAVPQNEMTSQQLSPPALSDVILPVGVSFAQDRDRPAENPSKEDGAAVLIVEDNEELRGVISDIISSSYTVLTAGTGRQALDVLAVETVDVIVSDLMMPEMDGYELCEFVKSDMRYSHIPIIQLTAKASVEDRIKGLEYGADAYIEKPFSPKHLLVQIHNILENRRHLREAYGALPRMENVHIAGTSRKDSEFLEKLNAEILANIGNEDFYIDSLAESLYMSRSNFYRKVKALLGVSPNEYLRVFRLEQAASLLRTGEYAVSDIYMHVGFSSISYFSSCFKKRFGVAPTKYIEEHAQAGEEPGKGTGAPSERPYRRFSDRTIRREFPAACGDCFSIADKGSRHRPPATLRKTRARMSRNRALPCRPWLPAPSSQGGRPIRPMCPDKNILS